MTSAAGESSSLYRELIIEEYKRPRRKKRVGGATHEALVTNPLCGDEVSVQLKVKDGRVIDAGFQGSGCAISQAAASLLTDSIVGKSREEASVMDERAVTGLLGFTPNPMRMKCAILALRALKKALEDEGEEGGKGEKAAWTGGGGEPRAPR